MQMRRFPGEHVSRIHERSCLDSPLDSQRGFTLVEFCILVGFLSDWWHGQGQSGDQSTNVACAGIVYTLPTRVIDEVHVASAIEAHSQQFGSDAWSGAPEYRGCKVHTAWGKLVPIQCLLRVASRVKNRTWLTF